MVTQLNLRVFKRLNRILAVVAPHLLDPKEKVHIHLLETSLVLSLDIRTCSTCLDYI